MYNEPSLAEILQAIGFMWKLFWFNLGLDALQFFVRGLAISLAVFLVYRIKIKIR